MTELEKLRETAVLCYIEDSIAYFTTQELSKQTGDDWNDAPYEDNAGTPYQWDAIHCEMPQYWIFEVPFTSRMVTPARNAPKFYSVDDINAGAFPWLRFGDVVPLGAIFAGTTYKDFCALIEASGGSIDVATLDVVSQADYETVLAALRDYIRISDAEKVKRDGWSPNDPDALRLAEIRRLAATAEPPPALSKGEAGYTLVDA